MLLKWNIVGKNTFCQQINFYQYHFCMTMIKTIFFKQAIKTFFLVCAYWDTWASIETKEVDSKLFDTTISSFVKKYNSYICSHILRFKFTLFDETEQMLIKLGMDKGRIRSGCIISLTIAIFFLGQASSGNYIIWLINKYIECCNYYYILFSANHCWVWLWQQ